MTTSPQSAKIKHTQTRIQQSFLELYAKKPITQISIKELTYIAKINRGTFYLHYLNLDELVSAIEDEHLRKLAELMEKFPSLQYSLNDPLSLSTFFVPVLEYIETKSPEFKILLSPHSRPNFRQALQKDMHKNLMRRFESTSAKTSQKEQLRREYLLEYIVSANLGIIIRWIHSDMQLSAEDVTNLISNISLKGPFLLITGI